MRITYIGHATLLVEIAGARFLTDPNYEETLGRFLPRVSRPGIALDALPALDGVFVTHAHADHLSFRTLELLERMSDTVPIYAPPTVAEWLVRLGHAQAKPIAPGDVVSIAGVTITAAAATHAGSRYGVDRWRSATNMYLMDDGAQSCFFAGDTALRPDSGALVSGALEPHGRRLDVALLPIGHAPRWKETSFRRGHLTSDDALELFERLGARYFIPYHWGTFNHLTSRAYDAIERLRVLVPEHARRDDVRILEPGESLDVEREA